MPPHRFPAALLLDQQRSINTTPANVGLDTNTTTIQFTLPTTAKYPVATITGIVFGIFSAMLTMYLIWHTTGRRCIGFRCSDEELEEFEMGNVVRVESRVEMENEVIDGNVCTK